MNAFFLAKGGVMKQKNSKIGIIIAFIALSMSDGGLGAKVVEDPNTKTDWQFDCGTLLCRS
ncbi:hypothetical protein C2W62_37180 [Candidatus Entotheonella serta]|nr:hypothetical protein C2W62_37180 [Candidatus Entotheonella serta]